MGSERLTPQPKPRSSPEAGIVTLLPSGETLIRPSATFSPHGEKGNKPGLSRGVRFVALLPRRGEGARRADEGPSRNKPQPSQDARVRTRQRGFTLAEAVVSLAITGIIITASTGLIASALRTTKDNLNRQFASQKAVSMLEELRALIQTQNATTTVVLDDYDDGTTSQPVLTTQRAITDPNDPVSGNRRIGGNWLFSRRVSVQRVRGANDLRLVNVKVYVNETSGPRMLAEVAGVLSTIGTNAPPTQVYDIYLIAIENVPGWWVYMQNIVPFVEGAMQDLEARHPGLQFRKHWIRKLSYGRDPYYTPYVNATADSTQAIPSVYFYPGRMPSGSAVENYYPPDFFSGRISVDGTVRNGFDPTSNALPYSLADQYNNGMRYPEERALFDARVAAGLESADAPTFRLLLDEMSMHPAQYQNAIVINLHGELFPFPPVRNYSDAAKDPALHPNIRAVTHAERIRYTNSDAVNLRVYSYHTNVANPDAVPEWLGEGSTDVPISIVLKGINWTPPPGAITAITGGVDFDDDGEDDSYAVQSAATTSSPTTAPTRMWWSSTTAGADTIISLHNSPLKTPCVAETSPCDQGGLDASKRLYALEYIPSPVEDLPEVLSPAPFTTTLATAGTTAKNTARWIISIPSFVLPSDAVLTVETRVGSDLTTGTIVPVENAAANLSRTYVWRGTDVWVFGDATNDPHLPITERYQLLGDPRHCPYADLKMPHPGAGRVRQDALGMGYNRYFDDFHGATNERAAWPGWSYPNAATSAWFGIKNSSVDANPSNDGWDTRSGMIDADMSRVYQILRSAVVRSHAVYTTMTGFSYYYVGFGNEIGYDSANGFANSIPVSSQPFTGAGGSRFEQSITNAGGGGVKYIRENVSAPVTGDYWWSLSWLGELTPDSAWTTWSTTGNLPTGVGANRFVRVLRGSINQRLPAGTTLTNSVHRTQEEGSTAFFWADRPSSTFHHRYQDGTTASLFTDGQAIADNYRVPLASTISNNRPFAINVNDTSQNPDHFLQNAYGAATTLQPQAEFYRHSTNIYGSALLALRDGNDASFVVVNGLSPTGTSGTAFISRWSFLSLIQSFLVAGRYSTSGAPDPSRVRELPRIAITTPNDDIDIEDPSSLDVAWTSQWLRWDGLPYTPSYPASFAESTPVRFTLLYSRDNGRNWLQMTDDSPAKPGTRPADGYLQTATSTTWSVPASRFPKGNYLIRVEGYRDGIPLHYSFHQYRAFFKR